MATAKKLPSGNYRVRVYDKETNTYKSFTAATKKEAEFMAAEYSLKRKTSPAKMTVGEAINKYIESKENILSPTTISNYRVIRRNHFQGIMNIPLNKLTQIAIQNEVNAAAKTLSAKTISNAHGLLSSTLNLYCPDLKLNTTLPKKQRKIKELQQPEKIIEIVKETDIELPVILALCLGLRMSEIRGIKRSDISNGFLTINNVIVTVEGKFIEKNQTKTYTSTRRLKLPQYIIDLINDTEGEYITHFSGQAIYKRFMRLLKNNNLPHMTFHDLRHLNASVMLQLGVPDKYAMERGGWATNSTLKNVYQHTFSTEREIIDNKIDSYFANLYDTKHDT